MDNFDTYNELLAITIPVLLMTGFVLQGHIYSGYKKYKNYTPL